MILGPTHGILTSWCSSSLKLRFTNSSKYRSPICQVLPFLVFISSKRLWPNWFLTYSSNR